MLALQPQQVCVQSGAPGQVRVKVPQLEAPGAQVRLVGQQVFASDLHTPRSCRARRLFLYSTSNTVHECRIRLRGRGEGE